MQAQIEIPKGLNTLGLLAPNANPEGKRKRVNDPLNPEWG
ncbi:hypothetical protein CLV31_11335 [Algoriphagus aquaeductus]|uniref:Uncharacterized protein n=1 Tax=Algoriphagus aquaeductus TaxID=475299 RepID=A0A326RUM2_9BACT|nr:hypothetical protein CLV31_11335 [Algoriphagus aquaeductus]